MGSNLSACDHTLEIIHIQTPDDKDLCCSFGDEECLYTNNQGLYVFKDRNIENPKWYLYQGVLKHIITRSHKLYLNPYIKFNDEKIIDFSLQFPNFYELLKYTNNNIEDKQFSLKVVEYNQKHIKQDYLQQVSF